MKYQELRKGLLDISYYFNFFPLLFKCLFLTILEAEKSKVRSSADPVSGEGSLPGL